MASQGTAISQKLSNFGWENFFYQNMSTQILRFFVDRNTCLWKLLRVLKRPNSRACALETTASFLALLVPCIPEPMKVARGPGSEDGSHPEQWPWDAMSTPSTRSGWIHPWPCTKDIKINHRYYDHQIIHTILALVLWLPLDPWVPWELSNLSRRLLVPEVIQYFDHWQRYIACIKTKGNTYGVLSAIYCRSRLRLQDTLFGVLRKIATARSISVRFSSNFHQMFASACKIW